MYEESEPHDLFDLAFKRLMHLSNTAVISFINGLFGTNHPLTINVEYFSTEDVDDKLKKTHKDMIVGIETDRYIIEIQRLDDKTMAMRIFIYSYNDALNTKSIDEDGAILLDFPKAAVIYLENTGKSAETLRLRFPDKSEHTFNTPVFNLLEHSIADLEKQNLQLLLPFCVLQLHEKVKKAKSGEERKQITPELIALLNEIETATENAVVNGSLNFEDTRIIIELLEKVYNRLYKSFDELEEANKMAEQFLELRTDKIAKELELRTKEAELRAKEARQEERQIYEKKERIIADNMRAIGLNDEQISRVLNVQ